MTFICINSYNSVLHPKDLQLLGYSSTSTTDLAYQFTSRKKKRTMNKKQIAAFIIINIKWELVDLNKLVLALSLEY